LGSPLLGAFLLMESAGLGGPVLGLVLLPGLLASGIGALVFVGLNQVSGLGTAALELPGLPPFAHPDVAQFGWALVIGVLAAFLGSGIRRLGTLLRGCVERRTVLLTAAAGLGVAALAVVYPAATGRDAADVLGSGEEDIGVLLERSAEYSVGALLLLIACKGLAYGLSLPAFRGGPVFPAMFIGAAGGIAMSHLPGLPLVAGVAMGIGAMCVVMLRLPLTSVLLATLLMYEDGLAVAPIVIVAVVVAHVTSARLAPRPGAPDRRPGSEGTPAAPAPEQRPATWDGPRGPPAVGHPRRVRRGGRWRSTVRGSGRAEPGEQGHGRASDRPVGAGPQPGRVDRRSGAVRRRRARRAGRVRDVLRRAVRSHAQLGPARRSRPPRARDAEVAPGRGRG